MRILIIVMIAFFLLASIAHADCDHCSDSRLACIGDSETEVLNKCGQPTKVVDHVNYFNVITATTYYYDLGPNRAVRLFTFRQGRVTGIGTSR